MATAVIRWKLNELMSRQRKSSRSLAEFMGVHENSVYRLRKGDRMPRLNHDTLDKICQFLSCQPGDLLAYEDDDADSAPL